MSAAPTRAVVAAMACVFACHQAPGDCDETMPLASLNQVVVTRADVRYIQTRASLAGHAFTEPSALVDILWQEVLRQKWGIASEAVGGAWQARARAMRVYAVRRERGQEALIGDGVPPGTELTSCGRALLSPSGGNTQ